MSDMNGMGADDAQAMEDEQNTQGTPQGDTEADTASGGAPEPSGMTDDDGMPVENPSGG